MDARAYSHLNDADVVRELDSLFTAERVTTAQLLICIAEVDARKLYLPAGFSSMLEYCLKRYPLSRDSALNRIRAARAGRRCPAIFDAVADGRLHLSAAVMIARHVTPENVAELISAAALKTRFEIRQSLAERFPESAVTSMVTSIPGLAVATAGVVPFTLATPLHEPATVPAGTPVKSEASLTGVVSGLLNSVSGDPAGATIPVPRYLVQFTIGQDAFESLEHVKTLLGHQVPSGDLEQVFTRLLKLAIPALEKAKFGATDRPQSSPQPTTSERHIPRHVKRAVWQRDAGQCTFVGDDGRRCSSRTRLEYDHAEPVACGGAATVENLRLRCRGHNQLEAERRFGRGLMERKRRDRCPALRPNNGDTPFAPALTEAERARGAELARAAVTQVAEQKRAAESVAEVIPYLRKLGFRLDEARHAAESCREIPRRVAGGTGEARASPSRAGGENDSAGSGGGQWGTDRAGVVGTDNRIRIHLCRRGQPGPGSRLEAGNRVPVDAVQTGNRIRIQLTGSRRFRPASRTH